MTIHRFASDQGQMLVRVGVMARRVNWLVGRRPCYLAPREKEEEAQEKHELRMMTIMAALRS